MTNVLPPDSGKYMHSGPQFPGESVHAAMGENAVHSLTAHMIRRATRHDNPVTSSRPSEAGESIRAALRPGANTGPAGDEPEDHYGEIEYSHAPYDAEEASRQNPHEEFEPVAARLRSGGSTSDPTRRRPTSPRTRRGPGYSGSY